MGNTRDQQYTCSESLKQFPTRWTFYYRCLPCGTYILEILEWMSTENLSPFSLSPKRRNLTPVRWQLIHTFCQIHSVRNCIRWYCWGLLSDLYEVFLFAPAYEKNPHENKKIVCVVQRIWGNKMVHMLVSLIVKYNFIFSFFPQNIVLDIPFANLCNKFTDLHYILS